MQDSFDCELRVFHNSQSKESQLKEYTMNMTCNHTLLNRPSIGQALVHSRDHTYSLAVEIETSIRQYFKSTVSLPTPSCHQHKEPWRVTLTSHLAARSIVQIWYSIKIAPASAKVEGVTCLLGNLNYNMACIVPFTII